MESSTAVVTGKPKSKLKGNKKEEKEKNPKGKVAKGKGKEAVLSYAKFEGQGLSYKGKLFGFVEVPGPRGDQSSVQAIQKLKQQAKQLKKGANEHKLKITFNITLQGVRLYNEKTQTIEHEHPIHKISFISHDPEDRHVFGYIYSPPRSAANEARKYYLFAIKSDKSADVITVQLYELFQVVYKMQENKRVQRKDNTEVKQRQLEKTAQPLEPLQNKMLLEMSNKIGGDQQQYPTEEHLYAEPTLAKRAPSEPPPEYAIPSDEPIQASSDNQNNEYQVPRQQNERNGIESENFATGFALSLSTSDCDTNMQEILQQKSDNVSTPVTDDDAGGFETVFDKAPSFPTEEVLNRNTFHVEFPSFENGFTSYEDVRSPLGFSESSNDSEKFNIRPSSNEMHASPSNQIFLNALDDSSNPDVKTDFETSKNDTAIINSEVLVSSEPAEVAMFNSTETKDDYSNSNKIEYKPADVEGISLVNSTTGKFSSFESEKKQDSDAKDVQAEVPTTNETINFVTQTSFEVTFETESEDIKTSKKSEQDIFSFHSSSDAFSSKDPFASTSPTNFDHSGFSAFADDDPFSPKGGSNRDTKSDPFAENDDFFTSDFSDVNTQDFDEPKRDISDEANSENDQSFESCNKEEDIFEAMFEAKMEGQMEDETSNKDENEEITINSIQENDVEGNLETPRAEGNLEHGSLEEEFSQTPEENQDQMTLPSKEDTNEPVDVPVLNNALKLNREISEEQQENKGTISNQEDHVNELNAFDFSSNDVYVKLKTAAPPSNRPMSPTEFSPPPLPPRPVSFIPKEPVDTIISSKIPPALPPRPSYLPSQAETTTRKPPELPPRLDLEESGLVETQLADNETNTESFTNDSNSPRFHANFDTFDFDNVENNSDNSSDTPARNVGSPIPGFGSSDPFKDPFADADPFQTPVVGSDPFQTPVAGDPFASSTSFDGDAQQGDDDFDPFSGNDPFAMTPAFNSQASFSSPFNRDLSHVDKPSDESDKDKFADFSTAFS